MLAVNLILSDRKTIHRGYFDAGLAAAGYQIADRGTPSDRRDLLVIWNRGVAHERQASDWEQAGGTVIVAENGYTGRDEQGRQLYAMSVHGHNGSGWIPAAGGARRFGDLGIEVKPWREQAGYTLVCGQRGIGSKLMASPPNWHGRTAQRLGRNHVKIRTHPKQGMPPATTLEQDLAGARECVIWSSSSGVKALILGIPVVYDAPHWICSQGATKLQPDGTYELLRDDVARAAALEHMAWGQWRVAEVESGEPFAIFRDRAEEATW